MASQNTSTFISQLYKSREVLLNLAERQGYNVSDAIGFSISEVHTMKNNNQLDMLLTRVSPSTKATEQLYIKYYLNSAFRPPNLRELVDELFLMEGVLTKSDTLLVVVKDINDSLNTAVEHLWESEGVFIILQTLSNVQFNLLDHVLVPPHVVLTEEEKHAIMNHYNLLHEEQFPRLSRTDPVAKAIGIRPGQVCKIVRPSKTAILAVYYRMCF